ncbi:pr1-like protein [Oryza sativa Japonica Group]|uniref:Pr1-like protein n=1 Tax=Oryza sativa subsp. japonica TaxID=39947 RepID=Q5JJX0_ORYSJ|nr:pr1-like protein [Oryza sativa Japonica Group]
MWKYAEGRGARTGSTGVGPTRQPHGPRWTGCTRLTPAGAVGPTRQPHPRARAADGRAPHGSRGARPKAASLARPTGRRRARTPMVAGGGHRRGGAAPERGEGRGKRNGRSMAHPESTTTTGTATEAERGGGAARVDEDGGVPAVGGRNGGVDEVDEDAAKPKEATPKREEVRGDDGGGPELGGDGGERERRRELDSDGERERRVAETEEGGTGNV